jgi:hypothetical protein
MKLPFLALLFAGCIYAASHNWQTGKLLEYAYDHSYRGSIPLTSSGSANTTVTSTGNTAQIYSTYNPPRTVMMPVYATWSHYRIEGKKYYYGCSEKTRKPVVIVEGDPIQFYRDGNNLFLKDINGKKHKARIDWIVKH